MRVGSKAIFSASFLVLAACSHVNAAAPATEPSIAKEPSESRIGVTPRNLIVPLLDAHQHMMSPAAMALNVRPPSPPAIAVPRALANLLSAREKGVDDGSYDALFAPDAMLLAEEHARWWSGKARILDSLGNFGGGRQFVPTSYSLDRSAGYVAGVLRTDKGDDTHTFVLGLRKSAGGGWRIGSEMKQPIAPPTYAPVIDAERVIEVLDDAGIRYATILSVAYWFDDPERPVDDRHSKVRAENDWVIAQTQRYPGRLIPFCGVSPLADHAIAELERCAALGVRGMKVHRNSKFDPSRPEDLAKLKQFFRAANKHGMAIVIHLRGAPQLYIDHVLPEAPTVPIQIAHMGSGLSVLELFGKEIAAGKPGTKNLWFDWTQFLPIEGLWAHGLPDPNLSGRISAADKARVANAMRRVGLQRILFGTDMPLPWTPTPRESWRKTILTLPLTDDEIRDIADNRPPYLPQ